MKHEDWLYLLEHLIKRGQIESAEMVARAMKVKEPGIFIRLRNKIAAADSAILKL